MTRKILVLPGDGIGPEVMAEVRKVLAWLQSEMAFEAEIEEALVGGTAYDAYGVPISDEAIDLARVADAVLLGAVGGPKWAGVDYGKRPEAGLLRLRKEMDVFANLRPAICFKALASASSLKQELVEGLDILFVRELVGGVYFGEPRGIETYPDGTRRGVNTQVYTTEEIRRVAEVAFELAGKRQGRVVSAEKSNVMESGVLWREEVTWVHDNHWPDIKLEHMLADNCAMQLVRAPKQFDVIVTDNLFGDLLSDEAAMLTGSLGMLPSASLGEADSTGKRPALYEPIHGSAPDIAGKGIANPIASVLSLAMAMRYSFDRPKEADLIEASVEAVLESGIRTADIVEDGMSAVSTSEMGDAIIKTMAEKAE
jgi:3-isopropylmalate dehydrogenase